MTGGRRGVCCAGAVAWWLVVVRGRSMAPTLVDGDRLLVRRGPAGARPGALVVVRLPGNRPVAVKRLLRQEPGGWWVERDNPAEGVDSWQLGAVPEGDLLGVVALRLWPRPRRFRPRTARSEGHDRGVA